MRILERYKHVLTPPKNACYRVCNSSFCPRLCAAKMPRISKTPPPHSKWVLFRVFQCVMEFFAGVFHQVVASTAQFAQGTGHFCRAMWVIPQI